MASLTSAAARLRNSIGGGGGVGAKGTHLDADGSAKLRTLRELPKSLHATTLALTAYPGARRERKVVFSHLEMYKMVETIARRLRESGVRPGTVCAFALPRSAEAVVYFFALQWIGAVAAPISTALSEDDMRDALVAVGAQTFCSYPPTDDKGGGDGVASDATPGAVAARSLPDGKIPHWYVYRTTNEGVLLETNQMFMPGGAAWSGGAGDLKLDPDEVSVHIMTSSAEVVPLTHRAMSDATKAFTATYNLEPGMTTLLAPPMHDMHAILVLTAVFYSGGHVVLPGGTSDKFDAATFWKLASTHSVKWFSGSADDVLDVYEAKSLVKGAAQPLRFVRVSGRIAADLSHKVTEEMDCPVLESYGTAESAGLATSNTIGDSRFGTVGAPVRGIEIAVFDPETKEMLKPGMSEPTPEGEIAVTGEHAARSYYKNETATSIGSFEAPDGTLWFGTGDRGVMDADGFLTVLGDSRELRAAEIAAMEEQARLREELAAEEEKRKAELAATSASRSAALTAAGLDAEGLDDESADAIIARLAIIEANQAHFASDLADKNAAELEDLRARLEEAEAAADRAASAGQLAVAARPEDDGGPMVLDVRMDELEAAVMAAAASAEMSAQNTREAAKAAKEVAESAYGANHSREVAITTTTGDQGALTKTVRIALDDVEAALRSHPAVEHARAFGRKDKVFGAEVFCAIVPKRGARVSEPWLKLHAQNLLPVTFVPKKFYYLDELPVGMSRRELSKSPLLKDLSAFSGYSEVKSAHVKGPSWRVAQVQPVGRDRAPRPMF